MQIPIALVEGEKKALALWRLANYETDQPRFIPIAISGVWNWRGTIGKTRRARRENARIKGPIADLSRVPWNGRKVFIIFDTERPHERQREMGPERNLPGTRDARRERRLREPCPKTAGEWDR